LLHEEPQATLDLIKRCAQAAVEAGVAQRGDTIGITAGLPAGRSGGTNLFKVHVVE
jgi:pyruvate kinase